MRWYEAAKERVREVGLPLSALKAALGVSTSAAVGHYLSGRRDPSPTQLKALADALGMNVDDFFRSVPAPPHDAVSRLRQRSSDTPVRRLRIRYAWSNPDGVSDQALIRNVLAAGRFEDILTLATVYGLERIEQAVVQDAELCGRGRLRRLLGNIRAGYEASHAT